MDRPISEEIKNALGELDGDRKHLLDLALEMMQADDGGVWQLDLLAHGALNRAVALMTGFKAMIEARNLICAGALLRLQLDTAARFAASFIVPNPHAFAREVFEGKQINRMHDRDGNQMTDRRLICHSAG